MKVDRHEVERRLERFTEAVKAANVKLTHQRLEIFREIAASLDHPDAESVYKNVRKQLPTVSLDTVYRTLWLLNNLGLISTLGLRRENVRFDANLGRHHHFVCTRCGLTRDIESDREPEPKVPASVKALGRVERTMIEFQGICSQCAKNERAGTRRAPHLHQPPTKED